MRGFWVLLILGLFSVMVELLLALNGCSGTPLQSGNSVKSNSTPASGAWW
jgi:hypothetical protein